MRRSEQREHIFKLLFMTQFNSENEMSDQVSMYFDTLGELEEKDQEAIQNKYQHILEHLDEIDQTVRKALRFVLVDQAEQVLAEALCCLSGGAEAERAMDRKLPGEKSRGTARLRQ